MIPATPLAAALLDLDGTLLDTAPDIVRALNALLAEHARAPLAFAGVRAQVSNGASAVLRLGFPEAEGESFERLRTRFLDLYRAGLTIETRPFPGFEAVLALLEAHSVPWGVVTNKPHWLTEPLLRELGLYPRAGCVISGDTLPVRKPDPLPLLTGARQLQVEPARCLYLGDSLRDMQAAQAAGMVALAASFGYIGEHDAVQDWPVSAWIHEPRELLPWVGLQAKMPPAARGAAR
ncbi:MAG TPA: HAD-IA family hydrolase [Steroidobacteraceae bacterium]